MSRIFCVKNLITILSNIKICYNNNNNINNNIKNINNFSDSDINRKRRIQDDEDSGDESDTQTLNIRKEIL